MNCSIDELNEFLLDAKENGINTHIISWYLLRGMYFSDINYMISNFYKRELDSTSDIQIVYELSLNTIGFTTPDSIIEYGNVIKRIESKLRNFDYAPVDPSTSINAMSPLLSSGGYSTSGNQNYTPYGAQGFDGHAGLTGSYAGTQSYIPSNPKFWDKDYVKTSPLIFYKLLIKSDVSEEMLTEFNRRYRAFMINKAASEVKEREAKERRALAESMNVSVDVYADFDSTFSREPIYDRPTRTVETPMIDVFDAPKRNIWERIFSI